MGRFGSQKRVLGQLLERLRPHWHRDRGLPVRIEANLKADRRLGSRDRKLYRELLYTALRYLPWIEPLLDKDPDGAALRIGWLSAETQATREFRQEASQGLPPCPASAEAKARVLGETTRDLFPDWCTLECPDILQPPECDVLLSRPPLWLRMQDEGLDAWAELEARGWAPKRSAAVPGAVELAPDAEVSSTQAFGRGLLEIQDIGSQRILQLASPHAGRWLDACAGAGGKTLQLAQLLGPEGRVDAFDLRPQALEELRLRLKRSPFLSRVRIVPRPESSYDGVLVDAPCSGSGTWRRFPHLRWTTRAGDLRSFAERQLAILSEYSGLVRPGGRLVYATCSLANSENQAVAARFLQENSGFMPAELSGGGHQQTLRPSTHDGDGFFVAAFRRS